MSSLSPAQKAWATRRAKALAAAPVAAPVAPAIGPQFVLLANPPARRAPPFYYTGRAGEKWISRDRREAFVMTEQLATERARQFNAMAGLHGLSFRLSRTQ